MRPLLVALSCALVSATPRVTAAFVPPTHDQQLSIEGAWDAVGTHPDGSTYAGRANIIRLGGSGPGRERYELTFHMPNGTFRAICLRARDVLGCGWGVGGLGVGLYRRVSFAGEGGLDGTWFRDGDDEVGRERWTAHDADGLDGKLTTSGTSPSGQAYVGAAALGLGLGLSRDVRPVFVRRGEETIRGFGIAHSGPSGSFFVTSFPAHACGAAVYVIGANGGAIHARWMDFNTPSLGLGAETLTRAP